MQVSFRVNGLEKRSHLFPASTGEPIGLAVFLTNQDVLILPIQYGFPDDG